MVDKIDRSILRSLQQDGRRTATALASDIGLTVAPCHRRLRELESSGVIRGYRADIEPSAVGLGFEAIVFVTLRQVDRATLAEFERQVIDNPHIIEAERLFGDIDYLLKVVAADLSAYQHFYDEELSALPALEQLTSTIVMKNLKAGAGLPL
ncbi:Lrp/AsnC ligand binding domain-containing protein [Crystallibacter degradans]|uniref:Lrp/AsnC ligand binding domain-containing protein n=1 Tax=Crystallibacter degradans TaxID=2726743 RepID=UPI0014735937|nr:Lrp/AsnC family transcriptional regulator [Arthrobacter sp. SF27]